MGKTRNAGLGYGTNGSPQESIFQENLHQKIYDIGKTVLIKELIESGVKFNKNDVIFITKDKTGQILWLEKGNDKAGLNHILYGNNTKEQPGHIDQFKKAFDVSKNRIIDLIYTFIKYGTIYKNTSKQINGRDSYERIYEYNGNYLLLVGIGSNGYIVTAYPVKKE